MSREFLRAIFKGDEEKFESLINEIDMKEVTASENWNYLHRALMFPARAPKATMIKKLIDCGVDVNLQDCYGNTPLHYAATIKSPSIIELLLNAGADIDHVNNEGSTPLRHMLSSKPYVPYAIDVLLSRGANQYHRPSDESCTVRELVETIAHGEDAFLLEIFDKYVQ